MNDGSFVQLVAVKAGLTNEEAEALVTSFIDTVKDEVNHNRRLEIDGLGLFEVVNDKLTFTADKGLVE